MTSAGFVAQGGMGAVYDARQKSLDRPVAIKILPREFGSDAQFRGKLRGRGQGHGASLNHPNLIGVYDFGEVDGMLFIIMEFVEGKSLHHSAHGMAIEQKEAARRRFAASAGASPTPTRHGILHRDIKPANILLTTKAEPKIGDFGLARPVGHGHEPDEVIFGTPGYSAPEVVDNPEAVDQRADIFAVGVILYELLTGQLPGDPWRPPSVVARTDDPASMPSSAAPPIRPRDLRYADANELADELDALTKQPGQSLGASLRRTRRCTPEPGAPGTPAPPECRGLP